jgi:2-dehydropantoate 2-reductase
MKICVVGLGAIGGAFAGWIGSRLAPGRVAVSALARGATLAAVRRDGLQLHNADSVLRVPLRASDQAQELGAQDLVIVTVKGPALASVAPAIAALCGPSTLVLSAMNGVPWWFFDGLPGACEGLLLRSVDEDGGIHQLIPSARVIGCVVHGSSQVPAPGHVQPAGPLRLIIGRPKPATAGLTPDDAALDPVQSVLADAGFEVTRSPRIQQDVWFKLWGNLTMNPVSALTGAPCDQILDDPLVRAFCSAVMLEANALGTAFGIPIDSAPEARHAVTRKLGSFKTSMLQDAEAGRPLELDSVVAAVREIGQHLGVGTPNIDALLGLTRLMARQRGLYPAAAPTPAL